MTLRPVFESALLHPLLAGRWSPASFDVSYHVSADEIEVLLEAARWAPSAGNSQPWAFIVGQRGDATHERPARPTPSRPEAADSSARQRRAVSDIVWPIG